MAAAIMERIVVVGAGQAGASLVSRLRALGHEGPITMLGDEPALPYERPPLSKAYLLGKLARERLSLRSADFYRERQIDMVTGATVERIDRQAMVVEVDGRRIPYDRLALTTGSVARRLPRSVGGDLAGVHVVRTLADVDRMSPAFVAGARALIVGGGYVGLEAAAVAASCGMQVTLIEMADRILQRVAAPEVSDYFRALHRGHGVDILESTGLSRLQGDERVTSALLTDGRDLPVDVVVVGIGIDPATRLAQEAGLEIENGIRVDARGITSDPAIVAAGDCTSFPYRGRRIRLESVQNAIQQADLVAETIMGGDRNYDPVPWFWSDQYDRKLQIAGLNHGYERIVTRGTGAATSFWYFAGHRLLAVDAINDARSFMAARKLLETGRDVDPDAIADVQFDLKVLLKA